MNVNPFIFRIFFISTAWMLTMFGSAKAQIWTQVFGPTGGDVEAIASDRSGHIYAGTDSGVYVSSDNGANWTQKNNGLANQEIFSFTVTPAGTVLAGTEGNGIFRTTDFGDSWDSSNTGLPWNSYILSLASDGHGNIYAGRSGQGVFYSSDDGLDWFQRDSSMEGQTIFSLAVSPSGMVYAGGDGMIFASPDEGVHWDTSIIVGPVTGKNAEEVLALATDSGGNVFAGTFRGQRWRLRHGNTTWDDISPIVSDTLGEVRALATSGSIIFAGLFGGSIVQSMDLGQDWSPWSSGLTDPKVYSITVAPSGYVFIGTFLADVFRTNFPLSVTENNEPATAIDIWPQPLNGKTTIAFSLNELEAVHVDIFDELGRTVSTVWSGVLDVGPHTLEFDAASLRDGTYLMVFHTLHTVQCVRCVCLR